MKIIDKNNQIFSSEEFQKDKYKFNLILQNLNSENLELYSDEENYIVCRGSKEWPTWIWTKDDITFDVVKEIENVIDLYLTDKEKDKFTCKKYLYDQLKDDGYDKLNLDDYFEMGFLICNNPVKPKVCDGYIDIPTEEDKQLLIKYRFEDYKEMVIVDDISIEKAKTDVENEYSDNKLHVWRNSDGKIVSVASYRVTGNQAKISNVFTPKEERKKGYAANLIYELTKKILEKNLIPLLYTDYNYIPSNRAYINAGYTDEGILINFTCSKVLNKTK